MSKNKTVTHARPPVIDEPPAAFEVPEGSTQPKPGEHVEVKVPRLTAEQIAMRGPKHPPLSYAADAVKPSCLHTYADQKKFLDDIGLTPNKYEAFATIFAWSRDHTHEGPMPCACPSCAFVREYAGPLLGGV